MIFIGLDPAFRKNGFAICCIEGQDLYFKKFKNYTHFLGWLYHDRPDKAFCCIENSNLTDATFYRGGNMQSRMKQSRNVGKNQAASQIATDLLKIVYGEENVHDISPKQKGKKWTKTYIQAIARQNKHTIPNQISQDHIDAYQIALIGQKYYKLHAKPTRQPQPVNFNL
jgi:hypothetical protein